LSNLSYNSFPNIKFNNTSTKEIERIIKSSRLKNSNGYDEIYNIEAFDCVNRNILLTKLEFYGITGTSLKLIKSYLEGRYQRVILNNNSPDSCSNWRERER
jgi:hypothetical protein